MAYISQTPKNHTYQGDSVFSVPSSIEHFKVDRFVKPLNAHSIIINVGNNVSMEIKLRPTQHWKVQKYDKDTDIVTLSYKFSTISIPMTHASQMFEDYDQTSDGTRLYKVGR